MINGFVKGQSLTVPHVEVVANSNNYLEVQFIFQTADWKFLNKTAYFEQGATAYTIHLKNDRISRDDKLNLTEGVWNVYLKGTTADGDLRITTDVATLKVKPTGHMCIDPPEIPLTQAEQFDNRISALEAGGGGGEGTADHTKLFNRDKANQHPISAITGLNEALEGIQPKGDYATKGELADKADKTDIPTKTSQLQNDSDFATKKDVDGKFDVVNKDVQDLTHDKLDVKYERIDGKEVSQLEARAILENPTEYEDKFIIFMANSGSPTKAVATGFIVNDGEGNTYLSVTDNEGHYKRFNKDNFETFEIIAKDRTKETLALDDLTIDVQGQAGFINSVHNAFNRPENTSTDGIIKVVAYNIENQLQEYTDVKNGYKYVRLVTGTANQHSFGMWQRVDITIANAKVGEAVFVKAVDSNNHPTEYETKAVGAGGAEKWEKINEITFNGETGTGEISTDSQGKPFELIKSQVVFDFKPAAESGNAYFKFYNGTKWIEAYYAGYVSKNGRISAANADVRGEFLSFDIVDLKQIGSTGYIIGTNAPFGIGNTIHKFRLDIAGNKLIGAGSKITLYGVRK